VSTSRLEAFSDGVFAIAMTLLVLDLKVPPATPGGPALWPALMHQWPAYLAFVTSFATIGIMWINHHLNFTLIRRADHTLLVLNGLLLLGVTFLPFPTALVAAYVGHPGDDRTAAAVYSGTFLVTAIFWRLLWTYAVGDGRLLAHDADPRVVDAITRAYNPALLWYCAAFAASFIHALTSLVIIAALAAYFALPNLYQRWFGRDESAAAAAKPPGA
jgi:TMEM175 potassium channel family protein